MYHIRPYYPHDCCLHMSPSHMPSRYICMGLRYGLHPSLVYIVGIIMSTIIANLPYVHYMIAYPLHMYSLLYTMRAFELVYSHALLIYMWTWYNPRERERERDLSKHLETIYKLHISFIIQFDNGINSNDPKFVQQKYIWNESTMNI